MTTQSPPTPVLDDCDRCQGSGTAQPEHPYAGCPEWPCEDCEGAGKVPHECTGYAVVQRSDGPFWRVCPRCGEPHPDDALRMDLQERDRVRRVLWYQELEEAREEVHRLTAGLANLSALDDIFDRDEAVAGGEARSLLRAARARVEELSAHLGLRSAPDLIPAGAGRLFRNYEVRLLDESTEGNH